MGDIRVLNRRIGGHNELPHNKPSQNRRIRRELERFFARRQKEIERAAMDRCACKHMGEKDEDWKKDNSASAIGTRGFARTKAGLLISAVLAAELFATGCGSVIPFDDADSVAETDVQDDEPDAQHDTVVPEDVQVDGEDVSLPDVGDADEASGDGDSEADAEDIAETEDGDASIDEVDTPICEPVVYTETRMPEPAGTICGINREKIATYHITEYGEGCPRPHRETSLESIVYRITRPLDLSNLICARGNETELLNTGMFMIIDITTSQMVVGKKIASRLNMRAGEQLDGGAYKLEPYSIIGTSVAEDRVLDSTGTFIRNIEIPAQNGHPARYVAINSAYGAFAWDQVDNIRTSQAIIILSGGLPIVLTHLGTHDYESPGDEGRFTVRLNIDGMGSDDSYGFFRDRSKK